MSESMPVADLRPEPDGRRRRAQDSRRRILEAMIALLQDGNLAPAAEAVAERAGVGRRTVFRLFSDMDGIYRGIHQIMAAHIEPVRSIPLAGNTPAELVHSLIDRRTKFFEEVVWISAGAALHRHSSALLQAQHAMLQSELRNVMVALLSDGQRADSALVEALDAVLSIDMWKRLRIEQKLGADAATALLHRMAAGLLRA